MSRIGKLPIVLPNGVDVTVSSNNVVTVKGPKGELKRTIDQAITVKVDAGIVTLSRPTEQKRHKALHGLYRSLINNMIIGVATGYKSEQELVGVGYRAVAKAKFLN